MKTIFNNIFNKSNNNSNISNNSDNAVSETANVSTTNPEELKYKDNIAESVYGPGYKTLCEIKRLEALQKDEKPQRKTVNLPEKYINSSLHPYDAQRRCFYRGLVLRLLYKIYEEERRAGKEISKPTCDPNFESWLKSAEGRWTYISYENYKGTPDALYKELHNATWEDKEKYYKRVG